MKIRLAKTEDAAALNTLLEAAFLDYVRGIGKTWPGPYYWMQDRIGASDIWVAEDPDAGLLGAMALSHDNKTRTLAIDIVAVDPAAQGHGVGRQLLARSEEVARDAGCDAIQLYTAAKYDRLVRFYQSLGFELTHIGPRPKGDDGHPRTFLRKPLEKEPVPQ